MMQATGRPRIARVAFYIGAAVVAAVAWEFQNYPVVHQQIVRPVAESLTQIEEKQLQAFLDMNRLLTTLGTTMLGALGFLLASGRKDHPRSRELWPAIASGAFAILSVFFGYAAYEEIIAMLQYPFFDLNAPMIFWPHRAHFYTLLLSVFFFGDFAIHDLGKGGAT